MRIYTVTRFESYRGLIILLVYSNLRLTRFVQLRVEILLEQCLLSFLHILHCSGNLILSFTSCYTTWESVAFSSPWDYILSSICNNTGAAVILYLHLVRCDISLLLLLYTRHVSVKLGCAHWVRCGHSTVNQQNAFLRWRLARIEVLLEIRMSGVSLKKLVGLLYRIVRGGFVGVDRAWILGGTYLVQNLLHSPQTI